MTVTYVHFVHVHITFLSYDRGACDLIGGNHVVCVRKACRCRFCRHVIVVVVIRRARNPLNWLPSRCVEISERVFKCSACDRHIPQRLELFDGGYVVLGTVALLSFYLQLVPVDQLRLFAAFRAQHLN